MNTKTSFNFKRLLAGLLILLGTLSLLYLGALDPERVTSVLPQSLTGSAMVDMELASQVVTLAIALIILAVTFILFPVSGRRFYRLGNFAAPAEPIGWLGIKPGDTWKSVGRSFALIVSLATAAFVYFGVVGDNGMESGNVSLLIFVPVLALMNAFTEEAITRLALVTALDGSVSRPTIYLISSLLFGLPHYFGVPSGWLGVLMAGFLGWLLAKSVAETEGIGWAWFIHFLQDVIIFTGLFLVGL